MAGPTREPSTHALSSPATCEEGDTTPIFQRVLGPRPCGYQKPRRAGVALGPAPFHCPLHCNGRVHTQS